MRIAWTQTRPARVSVRVTTPEGVLVRTVARGTYGAARNAVTWNGFRRDGRRAFGGRYVVVVTAENALGSVSLETSLRIRRTR